MEGSLLGEAGEKKGDVSARIAHPLAEIIASIAKNEKISKTEASTRLVEMLEKGENPLGGALQQVQQIRGLQGAPPTQQAQQAQGTVDSMISTLQMQSLAKAMNQASAGGSGGDIDFNKMMQYMLIMQMTRPQMDMGQLMIATMAQNQQKATGQEMPIYLQKVMDDYRSQAQEHKAEMEKLFQKLDAKETHEKMEQMQQHTDARIEALQQASDDKFADLIDAMNTQMAAVRQQPPQNQNDFNSQVANFSNMLKAMTVLKGAIVETGKEYGLTEKAAEAVVAQSAGKLGTVEQFTQLLQALAQSAQSFKPLIDSVVKTRAAQPEQPPQQAPAQAQPQQQSIELSPEEMAIYELEIKQFGGLTPATYNKILADRQDRQKPVYTLKPGEAPRPVAPEQPPAQEPQPPAPTSEEMERSIEAKLEAQARISEQTQEPQSPPVQDETKKKEGKEVY